MRRHVAPAAPAALALALALTLTLAFALAAAAGSAHAAPRGVVPPRGVESAAGSALHLDPFASPVTYKGGPADGSARDAPSLAPSQ